MATTPYKYQIFDCILESSIELPELTPFEGKIGTGTLTLTFLSSHAPCNHSPEPQWFHHWYLPNGSVNLSCGKKNGIYYLRFPGIAEFKLSILENTITGFPENSTSMFILRHLLLDQVVPRLLSHQGALILHASAVCFHEKTWLFLGESGQGKSTLAMALQQYGCSLLTDDCVKLEIADSRITCIPNYIGARLWPDSITGLELPRDQFTINDGWKTRLYFQSDNQCPVNPVKAIFFLRGSRSMDTVDHCLCTPVKGLNKFMEINKHCFPLDITDQTFIRRQFTNIDRIWKMGNIPFFNLYYPKDYKSLPTLCETILSTCAESLTTGDKLA